LLSKIRRRVTYANVAATLALVFAMSGGAYAATHYKITSKAQISPKVLKTLKGAKGGRGPAGPAGAAGAAGAPGAAGTALAWATVVVNGAGNPSFGASVGFTTVTSPAAGVYCVGPAIAGHPLLITPAGTATAIALGPSEKCSGSYQVESEVALTSGQGFIVAVL
jgi:hypothetical protein